MLSVISSALYVSRAGSISHRLYSETSLRGMPGNKENNKRNQ